MTNGKFPVTCMAMAAVMLGIGYMRTSFGAVMLSEGWTLQDIAKVTDGGAAISKVGYTPANWYKATVPGTVLTSWVNEGVYPEPLYGENNRHDKIPESLCRTSYWYRTETTVPAAFAGKHVWLNFDGINYTADIWVNGKQVGKVEGAFARGIFDVTNLVKAGEKAAIAVKINPPRHPGNPPEHTVEAGTVTNGGDLMADGPTFGCTVAWDWIPGIRDRDMGIWQKVTLTTTGPVRIDDPAVSTDLPLPRTDSADLTLLTTVRNATDQPQTGTLRGVYEGGTFAMPVTLQPREKKEVTISAKDAAQLHMTNPRLWWPNTYGEPNLYKMHVSFDVGGTESDARDVNFGVREITYAVPPDQKLIPPSEYLTVFVNGVPVMCKGGCWGMDEAMKRIPAEVLDAKVRFHKEANYTMIRNWVGQSTSEDFYNACDKYGLLIWDEMFQANKSDGPDVGMPWRGGKLEPEFRDATIAMYLANVREKVVRFRSHPSIALWCGRNESDPAPAEVAEGLLKITAELDPARFYQPNSGLGRGVASGGPYYWRIPSSYYGTSVNVPPAPPTTSPTTRPSRHRGNGLPGGLDPFKTELGSVSIPTLEAIKAWMPEEDWYDLNDDWASHDLCSGAQAGHNFPVGLATRYGFIAKRDLADFVRKSQMAMYETYRAMYEGRMARLFNPSSGVLTWMSNPSQPSFVWQLYSYDLEPLAALYGAKKGCEPLHIQMNQNDFHVTVINTAPVAKEGLRARTRIFDLDGTQKSEKVVTVTAKPCAATDVEGIAWPAGLSPVHFVKLELADATGKLVSENFYWRSTAVVTNPPSAMDIFGAGGQPRGGRPGGEGPGRGAEDLSPLQSLPTAELQVSLVRRDASGKCLIDATITNPTKAVALLTHLQLRNERTQKRVLPVFYSDNYISLLPGESRMITIEANAASLGADRPLVTLDGWNVTVADKTFPAGGGVAVTLNKDAFV
ncbi:MAG: glycosyl hydrolase 2 galactose-binding domain-containing protein, partial [Bacillota bacterium]